MQREFETDNNKEYEMVTFEIARSMSRSQQGNYQGSTIWSCRKANLRKKIPESLHQQSSTFKSLLLPTIKTIQKNLQ